MADSFLNISFLSMIITIFPLIVFILSMYIFRVTPVKTILNEISSSLNDYPLAELQHSAECVNSYASHLYSFSGSKKGCSCTEVTRYYYDQSGKYELNPGTCNRNQSRNGCENIDAVSSHNFTFWKNAKFCSKKYDLSQFTTFKGYLHYLNSSVLENEECGEGLQKCGKLDEFGNYLCYPKNETCPINDIQVVVKSSEKYNELINSNYTCISVGDKEYCYGNSANKAVITKLKIVEGKLCLDKTYYHTDFPQYILDNNFKYYGCRNKIEGSAYEKDVEVLDIITKKDLYDNDPYFNIKGIYDEPKFSYPFYSLEANMTLYPQRYIGYNKTCLHNNADVFEYEKINEMNQLISDIFHVNNFTKWFSLIALVLELLLCTFLNLDYQENFPYIITWSAISVVIYGSFAIPIFINNSKIKKIREFPLCGDKIVNTKINFYLLSGRKLASYTKASVVFANLQIGFIVLVLLFKLCVCITNQQVSSNSVDSNSKQETMVKPNTDPEVNNEEKPPELPYYADSNYQAPTPNYLPAPDSVGSDNPNPNYTNY